LGQITIVDPYLDSWRGGNILPYFAANTARAAAIPAVRSVCRRLLGGNAELTANNLTIASETRKVRHWNGSAAPIGNVSNFRCGIRRKSGMRKR
jgi:hypothetical protein